MTRALVATLTLVGVAAACGNSNSGVSVSAPDYQGSARRVIEGDLEDELGIGPLTGSCERPSSSKTGSTFRCTAVTEDGEEIELQATIEDRDPPKVDVADPRVIFRIGAQQLIEGELADQLAMGQLDSSCEEPRSGAPGTTFACSARTETGEMIKLEATVEDAHQVGVHTTNVLTVADLATIEAEAAQILTEEVGQELPARNIDCGDQPVVVEIGESFTCALTDPGDPSQVYDTAITLDDPTSPTHIDVRVAEQPRP